MTAWAGYYNSGIDWLRRHHWIHLIAVLAIYVALLVPNLGRLGISWDEQTDLSIARAYLVRPDGLLAGSQLDLSQTRLPMFTVALVYLLWGTADLITARLISCLIGGLTLLAVYVYCRQRFDRARGLLGAALLATSPFFLSFARVAFTETDIYLACMLAWLLVCVNWLQDQPNIGRAALTGIVFGMAVSAKFTAWAVLPAVWYAVWQSRAGRQQASSPQVKSVGLLGWAGWIASWAFGGWIFTRLVPSAVYTGLLRAGHYGIVLVAGWLLPLGWSIRQRQSRAGWLGLAAFITSLGMITFLVLPPEHLTNPGILLGLVGRFEQEMSFTPGFMVEAAALHILSILFKSSPVIGAGLLLGLLFSLFQWRRREVHLTLLVVLFYFTGLVSLPQAQTFYVIPLLPVLAVLAADQFLRLLSRQRAGAVCLAVLALGGLGLDLFRCYPDYNLNGYQWLGARWLFNRPSIGYRSVVQTSSDGVEQAIDWLNAYARPGESVWAYLLSWHIVVATTSRPSYRLVNAFEGRLHPSPDYVVVEINAMIPQSWWTRARSKAVFRPPYDPAWLEANYRKVFSVSRAFGIEMACVWQKKE
jgi:4-amino-4-deoxy-L-arabinose transferase-like glycosyltransferase